MKKTREELNAEAEVIRTKLAEVNSKIEEGTVTDEEYREADLWFVNLKNLNTQLDLLALEESAAKEAQGAKLGARLKELNYGGQSSGGVELRAHDGSKVKAYGKGQAICTKPLGYNLGDAIVSLACGANSNTPDEIRASLSTRSNGGELAVPETLWGGFLDLARSKSVMMENGCQTVTMDSPELRLVSVVSDPTIAEKAELGPWTNTDVVFGQVRLQSRTIGAVIEISREVLEDSPNAGEIVSSVLASAMAAKLDALALAGNGSSEMVGLCYHPSINLTGSTGT